MSIQQICETVLLGAIGVFEISPTYDEAREFMEIVAEQLRKAADIDAEAEQEMLALRILAEEVPPEPDTIASATDALYGQLDLSESERQELENQAVLDWLDLGASTNEMRDMADI